MPSRRELNWLKSCVQLATTFSTCSKRQYFAVVLMANGRVAGVGYNGSPPGIGHCNEGHCPRYSQNSEPGSNYDNCIAQHAEANALLWSDPSLRLGGTLIVNGPPCFGCAKQIASANIRRVIYLEDSSYSDARRSFNLLTSAGIELVEVSQSLMEAS
jgi:dCMP deaminase